MASDRRPVIRGPEDAWQRLGELLQLRRAELGYKRRPAFTREHGINIRLVTDIENAYRPNTFLTPTLREIAQAYQVTYESVIAVLGGKAGELAPALPDRLMDGPDGWRPPIADKARRDADAPYAAPILERLLELADAGIIDPTGAQVFGEDTIDAKAWDGTGARIRSPRDRAWFIAEIRRWEAAHAGSAGNSGTGA